MAGSEHFDKEGAAEQLSRWGRNINILGAVALGSAALTIPGPNAILAAWATLNAAQAGGFELLRRYTRKNK